MLCSSSLTSNDGAPKATAAALLLGGAVWITRAPRFGTNVTPLRTAFSGRWPTTRSCARSNTRRITTFISKVANVLAIGLAFIGGGVLAGPGRHEVAVRRFLAPYLRDHPVAVYSVLAMLFLLWLSFIPGIPNLGQVGVIVVLAALAVVGIEILRRQAAREF